MIKCRDAIASKKILNLVIILLRIPGGLSVEDSYQPPFPLPNSDPGVGDCLRQMMETTTVVRWPNAVRCPTEKKRFVKVFVLISILDIPISEAKS